MLTTVRTRLAVPLALVALVLVTPAAASGAATHRSSGCGRPVDPGETTEHVKVGGTDREYLLSVPAGYDPSTPTPLVFDFHGLGSNMQEQASYSRLAQEAGARGYVVITPNGQGSLLRHWSLRASAKKNPDVAFAKAMLHSARRRLCIDPDRVFSTGISNGAMFSTVLACALPGRLAAVAPVAGVNATAACGKGAPPVSVLAFHGTADPIVPYQGGAYFSGQPVGRLLGVPAARPVDDATAAWAGFDGCATPATTSWVADDVQHVAWPDCPADGTVELYRIVGGGHTWPGATAVRGGRLGATTPSIDATALMLDFFHAHPRTP